MNLKDDRQQNIQLELDFSSALTGEAREAGREETAIRLRLRAHVEVGTYLSGGVDSATVALLAARHAPARLKAFTIGFDDAPYDETAVARQAAEHVGIDHQVIQLSCDDLSFRFVDTIWHCEMPVVNTHGVAKFLLSSYASRHLRVVLTGEGADELLAGYGQFKHQALLDDARQRPCDVAVRRAMKEFLAAAGVLNGVFPARSYRDYDQVCERFGFYPYPVLRALAARKVMRLFLSGEFLRATQNCDPIAAMAACFNRATLASLPPLSALRYSLFKTELAGYVLNVLGDRTEMAHSLEGRQPFLDHHLVEFVCTLPHSLLLRGMTEKYILRKSFTGVLAPGGSAVRKKMFLAPSPGSMGIQFDEYLSAHSIRDAGVFEPLRIGAVRKAQALLPPDSRNTLAAKTLLVAVLSIQVLHHLFCRNFAREASSRERELPPRDPAGETP